jgi:hypothetical protein
MLSSDTKCMDAQHVSDEDREKNRGKSQVLNLLMIDSTTISTLGSNFWNVSNAVLSCKLW